ncbi:MAG: VIT1/CCC1 transporter family protein [Candidatus Bathyarchaeia archaeon]
MPSTEAGRFRLALYTIVMRLLGLGLALRLLEAGERDAIELYSKMLDSPDLEEYEARQLRSILEDELVHEQEFAEEESRFGEFLNHVRDAVLGMNDGLVEVLSVTAGLAGIYGDPFPVALGGVTVGVAGALSMGIGAFASARAQRQVHEGMILRIGLAARFAAHIFKERIVGYMRKKGYSEQVSRAIGEESSKDYGLLSRLIAEEERGLREEALEKPSKVGLYTGSFYVIGALVPLIPYFLPLPITLTVILSLFSAGIALALTGFIVAISANIPVKRKIVEMIIAGIGSGTITFVFGRIASMLFGIEV